TLFLHSSVPACYLHSFPTRRSSDLADRIGGVRFLVQGTLYPDVIESVSVYGPSAVIKSHHNVGGLPERMNLELIEPLRNLFKDRSEEHTSELQSRGHLVCRLLLEKK